MSQSRKFDFHDANALLGVANRPELQADEKPLFTTTKQPGSDYRIENGGGAKMHAETVDGHKLIYNPHTGTHFDTATDDYDVINPPQFIGPLVECLRERDMMDVLGSVWVREDGAKAYAQVTFRNGYTIYPTDRPHGTDPVRCGFQIRWSHDSGISVRADGFAQDTRCTNSLRQISSGIHVKHSGDVEERVDWHDEWNHVLDEVGAFSEALAGVIDEAIDLLVFDLRDSDPEFFGSFRDTTEPLNTIEEVGMPHGLTEAHRDALYGFYELLGVPKYLGVASVSRLAYRLSKMDDPRRISAWDLHSSLTYALTHNGRGTPGASDDGHHKVAADLLLNPMMCLEAAQGEARDRLTPDDDSTVVFGDPESPVDTATGDALRTYSERSRILEGTFGGD